MNLSRRYSRFATVSLAMALAACASAPRPTPLAADSEAFASRLIAEKVGVAADAQRDFAQLQAEHHAELALRQAQIDADRIDIDYIGSPQELLQTVANRYGYRYVEIGKRTNLKPINVRFDDTAPMELLRTVGHQVNASADVVLDKPERTIRLVYKTLEG